MLKIGIIGAGKISGRHGAAIDSCGSQVAAVADISEARARALCHEYGGNSYTDYSEMLKEESLDGVIINLPHHLHESCAIDCMKAGVAVLLEKPMANDPKSCQNIIDASVKYNVPLMIGHIQRYFPENRIAKEVILSGRLGTVTHIVDERNLYYYGEDRPGWFKEKSKAGGGIWMNFGAHSLDKILWLTDGVIEMAYGTVGSAMQDEEVDGHAQVFLTMQSGLSATINLSGYRQMPKNETVLYFTDGTLHLKTGKGLWIHKNGKTQEIIIDRSENPFHQQMHDFIDVIKGDSEVVTTGDYGKTIIDVINGIYGCRHYIKGDAANG